VLGLRSGHFQRSQSLNGEIKSKNNNFVVKPSEDIPRIDEVTDYKRSEREVA
jgi:hypothetical protein